MNIDQIIEEIRSHIQSVQALDTSNQNDVTWRDYEVSFSEAIIRELEKVQRGEKFPYALIWSMLDSMDYESPVFKKVMKLKQNHPELFQEPNR